ncbi:S-layer homology domain-containing protein [Patescibacteria group bacterium]|nr:S-layer homology domain-containing protein [Patescibacteria group bacterium]
MRFSKLISVVVFSFCFPIVAFAAVGVTSSELSGAISIVLPSGGALETLPGYSAFSLKSSGNVTGGIYAEYEARNSANPFLTQELPNIKIFVFTYANQDTAEAKFAAIKNTALYSRDMIFSDEKNIYFKSQPGSGVDIFGLIASEENSLHLVHVNGNIIYQASLYRGSGEYDRENVEDFQIVLNDTAQVQDVLGNAIWQIKLSLGLLFPPASSDFYSKSSKSSLNLSSLYAIPLNGDINFEFYLGQAKSAVGTILDSSGISSPKEGDLYLYLQNDGKLLAGIYAPKYDADCDQQSGWYRIWSSKPLNEFEWNNVNLHYGIGGFSLTVNGEEMGSCSVSQSRSARNLFFGDFPNDSIEESAVGYMTQLDFTSSRTGGGQTWDSVLSTQLFLDLPNSDPDVEIFEFLKDEGIFMGSDGMLYPDNTLNRAEMVKVLLKAFDYSTEGNSVPFWDVPADSWYLGYLAKAYSIGMVEGNDDGSFAPASQINRAEFYTMLYRISGSNKLSYGGEFSDVSSGDWYMSGAAYALENGLVSGSSFKPSALVSRRDSARVLYSLLK